MLTDKERADIRAKNSKASANYSKLLTKLGDLKDRIDIKSKDLFQFAHYTKETDMPFPSGGELYQ